MVGPASFRTLLRIIGLDTGGKGDVESSVLVIKTPSRTGRIGSPGADWSMFQAVLQNSSCAERMSLRERELAHDVSVEEQLTSSL
jgi:hypothetical protein